jgi:transposase
MNAPLHRVADEVRGISLADLLAWHGFKLRREGTFSWPKGAEGGAKLRLAPEAFAMLTDGVDLRGGRLRPWYQRD